MPESLVIGLDGCKAGWVMVCWPHDTGKAPHATIIPTIHTALNAGASCICVDMPIGFPSDTARLCETLARKYIGQRRSSVFPVPCRDALMADDYPGACEINAGVLGKKVPKQTFMLFGKMREIDAIITPGLQSVVHEVHPEVSFCTMNNLTPLRYAKKTTEGARLRRALLIANGFPLDRLRHPQWKNSQVGDDDILDACACAWSARRIAGGTHISFPATPQFDARGLRMQISA